MTAVDTLWYKADEADQQAERTYHQLSDAHSGYLEYERSRRVSRPRFRTLAERIRENGLPYGAHTLVYRESGQLLLVRHEGVGMWVVPGGEVDGDETFKDGARRELKEEAGVEADYDGLAILARVSFRSDGYQTWGVLPVFEGRARTTDQTVSDPDDEISDARWFTDLPEDTRDRARLRRWRRQRFGSS
ncbi:NUDIX hydrolase [Halorientalis salina]|uniref:NUDIX hydrolase n=1 Tax=Halorientalis salina TaxID=2932266 RepID=UPI0010AC27B1|nr:NUDIX domain-containing protein [Halorientalis salina]